MNLDRKIEVLERQIARAKYQRYLSGSNPEFTKWQRDTQVALENIFGRDSRHLSDFQMIRYSLSAFSSVTPDSAFADAFRGGVAKAIATLQSMIEEIREYSEDEGSSVEVGSVSALATIEQICLRFHRAARQLQDRHAARPTLTIADEYDVQDLLHALLKLHFDDIRPEESSPSHAGKGSRLDFLLSKEEIVVEIKKTRASLSPGDLGAELLIDIARYQRHPNCKRVGQPGRLQEAVCRSGRGWSAKSELALAGADRESLGV